MTALSASLGWVAPNLVSYCNDFWMFTMSRRQRIYFFCVCLFALRTQAYDTNMDMVVNVWQCMLFEALSVHF
jgi:hypothetical protein